MILQIFGEYDHVVCPSGSCASMVRVHDRGLLADQASQELTERLARVARVIHERCEFLVDVLKVEQATAAMGTTARASTAGRSSRPSWIRTGCGPDRSTTSDLARGSWTAADDGSTPADRVRVGRGRLENSGGITTASTSSAQRGAALRAAAIDDRDDGA
jgi:hypothetical protein